MDAKTGEKDTFIKGENKYQETTISYQYLGVSSCLEAISNRCKTI